MSREKKNQNASKRGTIETSSLRFARSKPQKNQNASKRGTIETSSLRSLEASKKQHDCISSRKFFPTPKKARLLQ